MGYQQYSLTRRRSLSLCCFTGPEKLMVSALAVGCSVAPLDFVDSVLGLCAVVMLNKIVCWF